MFVLPPDSYLMPSYRISPFTTADIRLNHGLPEADYVDEYFAERFGTAKCVYTLNGRAAINIALSHYSLQKKDIVTVLTTTGNFYVSGCVTTEIEKICKWSRKIEHNTKVILVNHEFGYVYNDFPALRKTGIPIIEDCAHSFFSKNEDDNVGKMGDFAIYSFPKMFPLQIGGLLVNNVGCNLPVSKLGQIEKRYIKNVLSFYIQCKSEIMEKRLNNYSYLSRGFKRNGFIERFNLSKGVVPGVFMFRKGKQQIKLPELKKHFYAHGIQCSVFYGEESFFVPVHQNLTSADCEYFIAVLQNFKNRS